MIEAGGGMCPWEICQEQVIAIEIMTAGEWETNANFFLFIFSDILWNKITLATVSLVDDYFFFCS